MHWSSVGSILGDTVNEWVDDNAPRLGASLAFYTLLSLAPLLVVVVAIAAFVYGREAAQGQLFWQIRGLIGKQGAGTVQELIQSAYKPGAGIVATIIGVLTLLFGASTVVLELQEALNAIWHVRKTAATSRFNGVKAMLKERFYAVGLILGAGVLLLISLLVNAVIAAVGRFIPWRLPSSEFMLHAGELLISMIVVTFMFAAIYKYVPSVRLEWRDVIIGAAVTALLFIIGKQLIAIYLGKVSVSSTYGAAGSLVAVLIWVYYSAQVFFMGAEFTKIYARRHGSHQQGVVLEEQPARS